MFIGCTDRNSSQMSKEQVDSVLHAVQLQYASAGKTGMPEGWWLVFDTREQEAPQVQLLIGTHDDNTEEWLTWNTSMSPLVLPPAKFKNVIDLYVRATSVPTKKNTLFYVGYNNCLLQRFSFDNLEDHQMRQDKPQFPFSCGK